MAVRMQWLLVLAACGGGSNDPGSDAASASDDAGTDAASDVRPPDPNDPVEEVPAYQGAYSFAKLTTEDSLQFGTDTWFTDSTTEHKVLDQPVHYVRYRDQMLLQDLHAARVWLYDQATTMVGAPITLPSDAVGQATVRGGIIYVGGLAKVYSYEVQTQMWRMRALSGAGSCHHVVAGKSRLFVNCTDPTSTTTQQYFSMWANKTMSDVVPIGTLTPGEGAEFGWLSAAPGEDLAYFLSRNPQEGCIGTLTATKLEPCTIAVRTLGTLTDVFLKRVEPAEDGKSLFVSMFRSSNTAETNLYEIVLPGLQFHYIRPIDSFATCPDGAVVFQDSTISQRYAGGVTTDVRLGSGGDYDMGCPLKPL